MHSFPTLLKKIRKEAGLTQTQMASVLNVSPVLIAMVETGKKEVSKNLIIRLAEKMSVHPSSITPFIFTNDFNMNKSTPLERKLIEWGEKMQEMLITKKSKKLKNV